MLECGSRAVLDAVVGTYREGEISLARQLVRSLDPGMLVLADRGFPSKPLWTACCAAGVDLLWRAKRDVGRRHFQALPDGSYLAHFGMGKPVVIRVIEYQIEGSGPVYRLLTSLLDPNTASAMELVRLYSERWETEIATLELKVRQMGGRPLRSRTEIGVRQEIWAHCLLHTIHRQLVYKAALATPDRDPDRISFSLAQDSIRRSLQQSFGRSRQALAMLIQRAVNELSALRVRLTRRPRSCPRMVYRRTIRYDSRANHPSPAATSRPPLEFTICGA